MMMIPDEPLVEVLDAAPVTQEETKLVDLPENVLAKIASLCPFKHVVLVSRSSKALREPTRRWILDTRIRKIQHFARFRCKAFSIKRLVEQFLRLTKLSASDVATMM